MESLLAFWNRLVAPSEYLIQADERRQARMLSAISLLMILLGWIYEVATLIQLRGDPSYTGYRLTIIITLLLLASYLLSRTSYYKRASWMMLFTATVSILYLAYLADFVYYQGYIYYLIIPILLANHFLPHRMAGFFSAGLVLLTLVYLAIFIPRQISHASVQEPMAFLVTTAIMILLFNQRRDMLERDRQRALEEQEERLVHIVDERTASLEEANQLLVEEIAEREKMADILEKRLKQESLLAQLSNKFINLPVEEIDQGICHTLQVTGEYAGVDRAFIFLLSSDGGRYQFTHEWCAPGRPPFKEVASDTPVDSIRWWSDHLLSYEVLHIPCIDDMPDEAVEEKRIFQSYGIQSALVVPLVSRRSLIGFMGFETETRRSQWDEGGILLLKMVAEILSNAISRRAFEELRLQAEKLQSALYEISKAANVAKELETFFPQVHRIIAELLPAENLYIAYYDAKTELVTFPYYFDQKNPPPQPHPLGNALTDFLIRSGRPMLVTPEVLEGLISEGVKNRGAMPYNWLGAPLKTTGGVTIGALVVQNYAGEDGANYQYNESDQSILMFFSTQVGMAIERLMSRQALADSEFRYRAISELMSDYAFALRVEEDRSLVVEWITDAARKNSGYDVSDIDDFGSFFLSIIHADDRPVGIKLKKDLLNNQPAAGEIRVFTKGGEVRHMRYIGKPVWDAEQKRVTRVVGAAQDITWQTMAEEALRAAREELEQRVRERTAELDQANRENTLLISTIASILIGVNSEDNVTHWNEVAEEFFNIPANLALGKRFFDLPIDWEWLPITLAIKECKTQRAKVRVDDTRYSRGDGTTRLLGMTINPMTDERSGQVGFLLVASDITERRVMEQHLAQSQKLESIGRLAAGIAHEINTPTQFVGSNLRFMQNGYTRLVDTLLQYEALKDAVCAGMPIEDLARMVDPFKKGSQTQYLLQEFPVAIEQSLEGIDRITAIVRAMRDFSHPGTEKMTIANVNQLLQSTIEVARNEWKYVAEVETDLDPDLRTIECLPAELNQVFLNMIINAVHAIQDVVGDGTERKGKITVKTRQDGDGVEIQIADTGAGIPEEIQDRIFDPFFTTKEVGKGTGQGLAIAHNVVVHRHGGAIHLVSEVGQGTTFILRLPYRRETAGD